MMFIKMDIFRILEYRNNSVYRTKKVAYHWFQLGKCPELNERVSEEVIKQNNLPPGQYNYCTTMEYVVGSRIPAGGLYK